MKTVFRTAGRSTAVRTAAPTPARPLPSTARAAAALGAELAAASRALGYQVRTPDELVRALAGTEADPAFRAAVATQAGRLDARNGYAAGLRALAEARGTTYTAPATRSLTVDDVWPQDTEPAPVNPAPNGWALALEAQGNARAAAAFNDRTTTR